MLRGDFSLITPGDGKSVKINKVMYWPERLTRLVCIKHEKAHSVVGVVGFNM